MLNSLHAEAGSDFEEIHTKDIKTKLPKAIMAFWEVVENTKMDVLSADGHPLGKTFKFKIDVSLKPDYEVFFDQLLAEPLYKDDYNIEIETIETAKIIRVSIELININNRL